jgi:hypothetical protein
MLFQYHHIDTSSESLHCAATSTHTGGDAYLNLPPETRGANEPPRVPERLQRD